MKAENIEKLKKFMKKILMGKNSKKLKSEKLLYL